MTALTPQAHAALVAEFKAAQAENERLKGELSVAISDLEQTHFVLTETQTERDRLNEAMKGAAVIAQRAGEEIRALKASNAELVGAARACLDHGLLAVPHRSVTDTTERTRAAIASARRGAE